MKRLLPALVAAFLTSCATGSWTAVEKSFAEVLVSDQDELKLGLQVHGELQKDNKVKFSTNPKVVGYVQGIVDKLSATAKKERPAVPWKLYVIDDAKTVNAFAVPGGGIYVYTGLLLAAKNEAQVVGVLGHEMGHVVSRHTARQLVTAKGIQTVNAMVLGENPNEVADLVANLMGGGAMLAYGREMENEADECGVRYAHYADYDSGALADFFQTLTELHGDTNRVLVWLSSHPTNADRIEHIKTFKKSGGFGGKVIGVETLAPIQNEIRTAMLPAVTTSPAASNTPATTTTAAPTPAPAQQPAQGQPGATAGTSRQAPKASTGK